MRASFCLLVFFFAGCASSAAPPAHSKPHTPGTRVTPVAASSSASSASSAFASSASASSAESSAEDIDDDGVMPAGLCGFNAYLGTPCGTRSAPRAALVLRAVPAKQAAASRSERVLFGDMPAPRNAPVVVSATEVASAQELLARGKTLSGLVAGYPFAIDWHDLPASDVSRRGIAIVAGLFTTREVAKKWVASHQDVGAVSEIVDLAEVGEYERRRNPADGDYTKFLSTRRVVVEVVEASPAYEEAALEKIVEKGGTRASHANAIAKLTAKCNVPAGALNVSSQEELYRLGREFAPVKCGRELAWVAWTSTRLESVVTRPKQGPPVIHQIVEVSCDSPSIASRPFGTKPTSLVALGTCRG